ncbi:hypothetical protein HYPSUDRAFT_117519, partial [Hypholoma sublateritium FD-334 SS-4]
QVRSLAKVVPTTSVGTFIHPSTSLNVSNARLKKEQIRLSHLPTHLQAAFDTIFVPRAREVFGYSMPWGTPDLDELKQVWINTFPDEDASSFNVIAQKLIEDRLHMWRNKFATSALTYLNAHVFPLLENNSTASRAELCTWLLSGEEHTRPFYFRVYEELDDEPDANGISKGLFQSPIISAILGIHFASISGIPVAQRSMKKPTGALVLTI